MAIEELLMKDQCPNINTYGDRFITHLMVVGLDNKYYQIEFVYNGHGPIHKGRCWDIDGVYRASISKYHIVHKAVRISDFEKKLRKWGTSVKELKDGLTLLLKHYDATTK